MKRILCLALTSVAAVWANAQVATIIEDATQIEYLSSKNCISHHKMVVQVNNERGLDYAEFGTRCDDNISLTSFSGEVSYAKGGAAKKIKKNELKRSEYSNMLATDSYHYSYSPTPSSYPCTVTYEWTERSTDAVLGLDVFSPQPGFELDVKKSSYSVTYAPDVEIFYALYNIGTQVKEETLQDGKKKLSLELNDLPHIKSAKFLPSSYKVLPHAYFVPSTFTFGKTSGSLATWQSFGLWVHSLQEGRMELPDALKAKLHEMTDDCTDPYQKLLKVYRLLEESTRYVSIQLGIGGLQPASAADVFKQGFGDCKGLSNYTVAMLREVGIDADYVVIGTKHEDLPTDFANMGMLNHAIAKANMPDGEVWIECTNPKLPLGYVHQGIAGHNAVIIKAEGGEKVRLPRYSVKDNTDSICIKVNLNKDGSAQIAVDEQERNSLYEDDKYLLDIEPDKQRNEFRSQLSLPNFEFVSHSVEQVYRQDRIKDERLPQLNLRFEGACKKYANVTGSRLFVPLLPYGGLSPVNATSTRTLPVQLCDEDYVRIYHLEMAVPEGYTVEFLPTALNERNEFGSIQSNVTNTDGKIIVEIRSERYSTVQAADKYQDLCAFVNKLSDFFNAKVVLKGN